jgi:hypothetical protein
VQKRPNRVESVGGDESAGDAVPEAFLDLGREATASGAVSITLYGSTS